MTPATFAEKVVFDNDGTGYEPDERLISVRASGNSHYATLETDPDAWYQLVTRAEIQRIIKALEQALEVMP